MQRITINRFIFRRLIDHGMAAMGPGKIIRKGDAVSFNIRDDDLARLEKISMDPNEALTEILNFADWSKRRL